jgi:hypothetical protein
MAGVAERPRDMRLGRAAGGRIDDVVRLAGGIPGRGRPDMAKSRVVLGGIEPVVSDGSQSVFMQHNKSGIIVYALADAGTISPGSCRRRLDLAPSSPYH